MANAHADVNTAHHLSIALLKEKLSEGRKVLSLQCKFIQEQRLDSLEISAVFAREVIAALAAYKRVYLSDLKHGYTDANLALSILEAGIIELISLQRKNRLLLVGWIERSSALLENIHSHHFSIPQHSYPDRAHNILANINV